MEDNKVNWTEIIEMFLISEIILKLFSLPVTKKTVVTMPVVGNIDHNSLTTC